MITFKQIREAVSNPFQDRLNKIIQTPANTRPEEAPVTLGSPSDRGPSQVPPIRKESAGFTTVIGKRKVKKEI